MTKQDKTYSGMIGDLGRLTAALAANATELTHLDGIRVRLEKILADAQEAAKQQAALIASKQEVTKRLKTLITDGQRVATGVDKFLKEHYGLRAEKLAEFGLQPFRGRKVKQPEATEGAATTTQSPPAIRPTNSNP
ncbi:MAG TPA: hypothetical protein VLB76_06070 [Thermoanaerobaculia bacterium]|jgi:hypothetical protein|nr:hypothetical protein [Thermoanaerobaculia bacterium]